MLPRLRACDNSSRAKGNTEGAEEKPLKQVHAISMPRLKTGPPYWLSTLVTASGLRTCTCSGRGSTTVSATPSGSQNLNVVSATNSGPQISFQRECTG